MKKRPHNEDEPLIEGVEALPEDSFLLPRPPEELRQSILLRTERVVRARSRKHGFVILAVAAAAYLGGFTTSFFLPENLVIGDPVKTTLEGLPGGEGEPAASPIADTDPDELVRRSESVPNRERTRLLTRAGDLYLSERYDVERALACYRRALDAMPAAQRIRVEPDDTWLLAALKDARR